MRRLPENRGEGIWTKYLNLERCAVYDCCVRAKGWHTCADCDELPCSRFTKDPILTEEENEAGLKKLLENLMNNFSETP